jgi:hypothetical protein
MQSQLKKVAMWTTTSNSEVPKPLGAHGSPHCALDARHRVCSCFGLLPTFYFPIPPFGIVMFNLCLSHHYVLEGCDFVFFIFIGS